MAATRTVASLQGDDAISSASRDEVFFPQQITVGDERAVLEALLIGQLVMQEGCLRIHSVQSETSYVPLWPPDFSLSVSQDNIRILDAAGRAVARVGEMVRMGGGEVRRLEGLAIVDRQLQRELPTKCPGPYWIVGDFPLMIGGIRSTVLPAETVAATSSPTILPAEATAAISSPTPSPTVPAVSTSVSTAVPAADEAVALLERYNWKPHGEPMLRSLEIPPVEELHDPHRPPFNHYLEASRVIGLDFTPWAGQRLQLRRYLVGHTAVEPHPIYGVLLMAGERVVGAYLGVEGQVPGIHPLTATLDDLSPPARH